MKQYRVEIVNTGRSVYVALPFDVRTAFGRPRGTLYARTTLNGQVFRGRLTPLGGGQHAFMLNKARQKALGYTGAPMTLDAAFEEDLPDAIPDTAPGDNAGETPPPLEQGGLDVLAAITTRASIRRYTDRPVDARTLATVLNAGFCAPSASNKRPWHFVVVRGRETLAALSVASPYAGMLAGAPVGIVVCADTVLQGMAELYLEDCAAAIQNILLAAHGLGLGAVWCGMVAGGTFRKTAIELLALPDKIVPMAALALGWPAEQRARPPRFEPARVHRERW